MADTSSISVNRTGAEKLAYFSSLSDYDGPQNPLNQFRSYSYHFVLYVTDSTDNAEQLGNASSDVDQYDQIFGRRDSHKSIDVDNYFDKYDVREFDGIKYITLINSFEDADLFIDDFHHTAATTAATTGAASQVKSDVLQVGFDTTFKIFEPMGCRLLEILSKAHSDLGVVSPIYGLKVYFIGRRDELALTGAAADYVAPGPDDVGYFYTLKPILFTLMDVTLNVNTNGTTYQFTVSSIVNGVGTPLGKNLSGSAAINKRDPTLEEVCKSYVASINEAMTKSKEYVDEAGVASTIPVEYDVEFEDTLFNNDPNVTKHIKDSIVDNITNMQRSESGIIIQSPPGLTFPSRISFIAQLCTELTSVPQGNNKLFTYAVTSTTSFTPEKIRYVAHVTRKKLVTIPVATGGTPEDQVDKLNEVAYEAYEDGRLLHYQYYFSGRNVDVIKYDLSVSVGLGAIYSSFSPAKPPNQASITTNTDTNDSVTRMTTTDTSDSAPKPHLGYQTSPSSSRNLNNPSSRDAFVAFMRQYMLGDNSALSTMNIRGNPKLFQASIATPSSQSQDGQSNAQQSTKLDDKNVVLNQILVKVDVYSPSRRWASSYTDEPLPETTFNESFWHGGLFHLVTVKSSFVNGTFTQELTMSRVPTDSNRPITANTSKPNQQGTQAGINRTSSNESTLTNQPQGNCSRPGLGKLSEQYESGGRGATAIGNDRTGGYSYGTYQIATKTGTFANYMSYIQPRYTEIYNILSAAGGNAAATAGTAEFQSTWRGLGGNPYFAKSQHEFIQATHFDVLARRIRRETGLDVCEHSNGLQDVVWSVAVQHGPGSNIVSRAIRSVGATASDADIINAVYDDRSRVDVHFAKSTTEVKASVKARFDRERKVALSMI